MYINCIFLTSCSQKLLLNMLDNHCIIAMSRLATAMTSLCPPMILYIFPLISSDFLTIMPLMRIFDPLISILV